MGGLRRASGNGEFFNVLVSKNSRNSHGNPLPQSSIYCAEQGNKTAGGSLFVSSTRPRPPPTVSFSPWLPTAFKYHCLPFCSEGFYHITPGSRKLVPRPSIILGRKPSFVATVREGSRCFCWENIDYLETTKGFSPPSRIRITTLLGDRVILYPKFSFIYWTRGWLIAVSLLGANYSSIYAKS